MPLNRLRRILQNDCTVRLDSSATIVQKVQQKIAARQARFQANGKQRKRPANPGWARTFRRIQRDPAFFAVVDLKGFSRRGGLG
jgi:hypothetical protein